MSTLARHVCAVVALLASAACADLERRAPGVCGNGVVEPGEDCDVYPAHEGHALRCGTERERACRYVCDPAAAEPACPSGWACGSDGSCAYASGDYVRRVGSQVAFEVDDWDLHDVDGDGTADLTGYRKNAVLVRFAGGDGQFPVAFELETPELVARAAFDDLDGDGAADALVPLANGIYLLRGAPRSLEPVPSSTPGIDFYPPETYPGGARMTPLRFHNPYFSIDEIVAVAATDSETVVDVVTPRMMTRATLPEHHPIATLTLPLAVADIDTASPSTARELALAFAGDDTVWIYGEGPELGGPNRVALRAEVPLPGMALDQGAAFADVNGDGHVDLLASVDDDRVAVALGDGAGGFDAPALDARFDDLLEIYDPAGVLEGMYTEFRRWPILAADLNGDAAADYVSPNGVYLADPMTGRLQQNEWRYYLSSEWTQAVAADFNGDGFVDVAAIADPSAGERGIDVFFGSASSELVNFHVPTSDTPGMIATGDFDGDFVADLAVVQRDTLGGPDSLWVLYGNHDEGLSAPISMGTYFYASEIGTGLLRGVDAVPGFIDDIALRGTTGPDGSGEDVFTFVFGAPVRRMVSVYWVRDRDLLSGDEMHQLVTGRFAPGQDQRDALAVGVNGSRFLDQTPRLWLLPGVEGAAFATGYQEEIASRLGDETCPATRALMTAIDLDGDGVDEVAAIDQSDACETLGTGTSPAPRMLAGEVTEEPRFALTELGAAPGGFRVPYQLEVADLDGDGGDDLVATFAGEYLVDSTGALAEGSGAVVFWNTGGTLDPASASIVLVPPGVEHVVSAVPLDADEDAGLELALLTDAGLFVCELDGDRAFSTPCRAVAGVAGLRRTKGGGERLRVADVNRDGLDDVLVGRRGQVDVYLAVRHVDAGEAGTQ